MGTAPYDQQRLVMPDPERTCQRSVMHLMRKGFSRRTSLMTIVTVCNNVLAELAAVGVDGNSWLAAVADAAAERLSILAPSPIESEGNEHADGSGS